ncbi:hypothetical protein DI09_243p10 [Mitosporidium daphniae]|uniref:Uncharacterized protein n=1 Tax=Mitosporidium daphniae TaxID=1485682 RepID=A0A098VW31_9MICR|nr:hypothetical protein DI09_243p10 [Mitosporidium daphniae]|eukprot:XP_013238357.1 uncharacterized protein DI09_243p10 [Mitosporidium daphniae]
MTCKNPPYHLAADVDTNGFMHWLRVIRNESANINRRVQFTIRVQYLDLYLPKIRGLKSQLTTAKKRRKSGRGCHKVGENSNKGGDKTQLESVEWTHRSVTVGRRVWRYAAPSYYTEAPQYYTTKAVEYYTTKAPEYYTKKAEYYTTTYAVPVYYTEAPKYYPAPTYYQSEEPQYYTTKAPEYYTTSYATPSYYTEAPKYYTTKAPEYYTTTYAAPSYYTEAPKYYSAPSYYTEAAPKYY